MNDEEVIREGFTGIKPRQEETDRQIRKDAWDTATEIRHISNHDVCTNWLISIHDQHLNGRISIDQIKAAQRSYYDKQEKKKLKQIHEIKTDIFMVNTVGILLSEIKTCDTKTFLWIHEAMLEDISEDPRELRTNNSTNTEMTLYYDTVRYVYAGNIMNNLDWLFEKERDFEYRGLSQEETIEHLAEFTAELYRISPFAESNTQTIVLFLILYLRLRRIKIDTNALNKSMTCYSFAIIRSAYTSDIEIEPDRKPLELFFEKILFNPELSLTGGNVSLSSGYKRCRVIIESLTQNRRSFFTRDKKISLLVLAMDERLLAMWDMMKLIGLKDRKHFLTEYLARAIKAGYVSRLYPEAIRHPRQQYHLTKKGLKLLCYLKYGKSIFS